MFSPEAFAVLVTRRGILSCTGIPVLKGGGVLERVRDSERNIGFDVERRRIGTCVR